MVATRTSPTKEEMRVLSVRADNPPPVRPRARTYVTRSRSARMRRHRSARPAVRRIATVSVRTRIPTGVALVLISGVLVGLAVLLPEGIDPTAHSFGVELHNDTPRE